MSKIPGMFSAMFGGAPAQQPVADAAQATSAEGNSNGDTATPTAEEIAAAGGSAQLANAAANGATNAAGKQAGADDKPKSPLDNFADLWETKPNSDTDVTEDTPQTLDSDKLNTAVGNIDFASKHLTPEVASAMAAGGDDAVKAFASVINSVARETFASALQASDQITNTRLGNAKAGLTGTVNELIRKQSAKAALTDANSGFKHAAVAPILDTLKDQLAAKYPDASPTELATMSQDYLKSVASLVSNGDTSANATDQNTGDQPATTDWGAFFDFPDK